MRVPHCVPLWSCQHRILKSTRRLNSRLGVFDGNYSSAPSFQRGPVLFRAKLVSPVLHSGLVGDYITWMIVDFDALALALCYTGDGQFRVA
jgi:hypothetical protein